MIDKTLKDKWLNSPFVQLIGQMREIVLAEKDAEIKRLQAEIFSLREQLFNKTAKPMKKEE